MALEDYSWADRMVHRIAFGTAAPQHMLRDMEQNRYGKAIAAQPLQAPIFITALPRAGTTLLLEVLAHHPDVVSHTYRDMPFVLSPIIWKQLSARFQVRQDAKERSHGDGIMVDADSPEAFEEIFWLRHVPEDFSTTGIALRETLATHTAEALRDHMRALIVSRTFETSANARYVSKNNANIARLPALAKAFPDARIIIPLRHPVDQARSLLRQHQKALASHSASRFASAYPRDIGHFEFGSDHRPIMFPGMDKVVAEHAPETLDYWLAYWIAAMRHVQATGLGTILDMSRFTRDADSVSNLFASLGLAEADPASAKTQAMIAPIRSYDTTGGSPLAEEAIALYHSMQS